jgi:hypothetical protein
MPATTPCTRCFMQQIHNVALEHTEPTSLQPTARAPRPLTLAGSTSAVTACVRRCAALLGPHSMLATTRPGRSGAATGSEPRFQASCMLLHCALLRLPGQQPHRKLLGHSKPAGEGNSTAHCLLRLLQLLVGAAWLEPANPRWCTAAQPTLHRAAASGACCTAAVGSSFTGATADAALAAPAGARRGAGCASC